MLNKLKGRLYVKLGLISEETYLDEAGKIFASSNSYTEKATELGKLTDKYSNTYGVELSADALLAVTRTLARCQRRS